MSQSKSFKINIVGSNTVGYVGEIADELLIAKSLKSMGHKVQFIPRDIWKAYTDGEWNEDWKVYLKDLKADINILCKWHHFNNGKYINHLRQESQAPVFYWTWDFMDYSGFHKEMVDAADLFLGNDVFDQQYNDCKNKYYFPFDCADADLAKVDDEKKKYEVVFFGSCLDQGDRKEWLPDIARNCQLKIFAWNWEEWKKLGLDAEPAVWGHDFCKAVTQAKICLQFSVNDHTWGYWSNRVGKVLTQGGFLMCRYAPGMELFFRDGVEYFSSVKEAIDKINYYLENKEERIEIARKGWMIGRDRMSMQERAVDLTILIDRYLKGAFI